MTRTAMTVGLLATVALSTPRALPAELVDSPEEVSPVLVGTPAPDGPLKTAEGRETTLGELRDGRPTVLVFYRGFW